jgi:NMD protein affecting ribosome stability and mRNA decay
VDSKSTDCYFVDSGVTVPKKTSVQVCKECKAINWKGMWIQSDHPPEHYLVIDMLSKTKIPVGAEIKKLEIKKLDKDGKVQTTILLHGKEFVQTHEVDVRVTPAICIDCRKIRGKQYEAVLQIRADEETVRKIIFISEQFKKSIIKVEDQKKGVDIYVLSTTAARHLASQLRKQFRLKMKESFAEYSWDKTKNRPKYRVTISLQQQ